jgi:chemotaxis protein methyltransferase CheR
MVSQGSGDLGRFRELLRTRFGISVPDSRLADLERAVGDAARVPGAAPLDELLAGRPGAPLDALVAGLNLGETYFFRDAAQVQALEQRILPELIRRRWRQRRLRVWSAGCSGGEEAYTLALLLHRLTCGLPGWTVSVLGSDINGCSLRRAGRGVYRPWSLRGVPPSVRAAYLRPHAEGVEVAPHIRAMVRFEWLNLAGDGYPSAQTDTVAMDLIVCRNVLLYFGAAEARAVLRRFSAALGEGGWLLLGQVEAAALGDIDGLRRVAPEPAAFQRVAGRGAPGFAPAGELGREPLRAVLAPAVLAPAVLAGPAASAMETAGGPEVPGEVNACTRAVRLWQEGRHRQALAILGREADRTRLLPGVHYLYGLVLLDCGMTAAALAAFRRCLYADPEFVLGYVGQAGALARAGQRRRAGAALDTASQLLANLDPDDSISDGVIPADVFSAGAVQGGSAGAMRIGVGVEVTRLRGLIAAQRQLLDAEVAAGHG